MVNLVVESTSGQGLVDINIQRQGQLLSLRDLYERMGSQVENVAQVRLQAIYFLSTCVFAYYASVNTTFHYHFRGLITPSKFHIAYVNATFSVGRTHSVS
jgi:hypothetical protein